MNTYKRPATTPILPDNRPTWIKRRDAGLLRAKELAR